jgi:UDP-GlcNAc:undecaprenyl-phosphate GlcNAc-1-phosphate transferase
MHINAEMICIGSSGYIPYLCGLFTAQSMNNYLVLIYAGFFVAAMLISLLLNGIMLRFAQTLGIRNNPEQVRWNSLQKPSLGGITFYVLFLLSVASYGIFFPGRPFLLDSELLGILGSITLAFLMGLADDAYNTRPVLKFSIQLTCGWILIASGLCIDMFEWQPLNVLLTLLWVVGIMNSINMLDNMDAITACVALFILLEALVTLYVTHDATSPLVIILIGVIGALAGFLFFNWHPSRLYMGDTGSQFLGIVLAIVGIRFFWNQPDFGGQSFVSKRIIITSLAFLIPFADTFSVVVNRLRRRQSPFVGGKDHTTHHLSYLGLSDSQVALAFCGISMIAMMLIFVVQGTIVNWELWHVLLFGGFSLLVIGGLYAVTRISKPAAPAEQQTQENQS